jgi:hypothetical protein
MQILEHHPNKTNGLKRTRIIIKSLGKVVDDFTIPKYQAVKYCRAHPNGKYGKRFALAEEIAKKRDEWLKEMEKNEKI